MAMRLCDNGGPAGADARACFAPPLGSAACRLAVLGSQNRHPVWSSRHVPIERKHSSDASGLDILLIG
jgi:hypothetical protein